MYSLDALNAELKGSSFSGKLHFSSVTGSTNADAQAAALAGAPHGSVWFADEQTAGRGRGNHTWVSNAGQGLYVSILLRPQMPIARLPLLPLAAGLAAMDAIESVSGLRGDLRWPNDLLIGERKTGGILVESKTAGEEIAFAIVGIGINVHQRAFAANLATPATSLDLEAGRTVSRQDLLAALLKSVERENGLLLDAEAVKTVPARVAEASTWIRGRHVEVHGPQACVGITEGLDEHGFLRVRTADGIATVQTGGIRAAQAG
ncbi:MAG: biotin--[acetyl-CoA-carboxylase] ligase [Acidobacteriota bacterium]|nr:biotin--[acetyl-CoA-carboxylase] ligase [Acidobacteriota bacterium]